MDAKHLCMVGVFGVWSAAVTAAIDWNGHVKYQPLISAYSSDSVFSQYIDSPAIDHNSDTRINFKWQDNSLTLTADYQLQAKYGDSVKLYTQLDTLEVLAPFFPSDSRRLMDLTDYLVKDEDRMVVQRLDRIAVSWTGQNVVAKLGRQAVSWGNGLLFNPMDFFNPFDPTSVDKEYKTGDDMLYGQYLYHNGSDLQAVWLGRRNVDGNVTSDVSSFAVKYHGFWAQAEYDLLVAQHYSDTITAAGLVVPVGGAIARADIVTTKTEKNHFVSVVVNWSYSWLWWNKNTSGTLEYYRNGVGISDGEYSQSDLADQTVLLKRLARGESYNLARDYLAARATIEIHPLWLLTPNMFYNLNDRSYYLQIISAHNLNDNLQLDVALKLPVGEKGTEYGGIEAGISNLYLSTQGALFIQLAWYF